MSISFFMGGYSYLTRISSPILRRAYPQMLLHVTAEIGRRRETEQVGNTHESQRLIAEQAGDVEHGVAVYPVVGGVTAYLAGNFGQVFGRHTSSLRGVRGTSRFPAY